ncbi:unnamed protein product [Withania somnifera]
MENGHESLSNGKPADHGRHPLYQSCGKLSLSCNFMVDDSTPECLTLNHIPLRPDILLEVNGTRCSMYSEGASCLLRRDRVDKKSEEATFVSTDSISLTGSVKFEVFNKDDLVLSGFLKMSNSNGFVGESKTSARKWNMNCEPVMNAGTGFLKVFITGCFSGTPIILTKSLQLNHRKKHNRKGMLHSIPEHETDEQQKDVSPELDLQVAEYRKYEPESEEDYNSMYWRQTEYMDGEDGELSWFNAGVRVGVGIGLGICVGVGIGVGLLVRTYQTTTRNFRRRFI